jgi:nucleoside-diphosphate-sugar epimerase
MIGRKLAQSLSADGHRLTLADVVPPPRPPA